MRIPTAEQSPPLTDQYSREDQTLEQLKRDVLLQTVIGTPWHVVGTNSGYKEPPYATKEERESLRGEQYALAIIAEVLGDQEIDGYELTPLRASELIAMSTDTSDPTELRLLKRIAEKLCLGKATCINNASDLLALTDAIRSSELRDFIAHVYTWSHPDSHDTDKIIARFMELNCGFRVEASFIKLARKAGHTVEAATHEQDAAGVDCFVDGVPFNIKSSTMESERYARHHINDPYRSKIIKFTPPFTASDFAGELIIPDDRMEKILEETPIREMIDRAIGNYVGEYLPIQNTSHPTTEEIAGPEQFRQVTIDQELDKLALNATRHWHRKVKKAVAERWG